VTILLLYSCASFAPAPIVRGERLKNKVDAAIHQHQLTNGAYLWREPTVRASALRKPNRGGLTD
jgi:hypothetical protein